MPPDSMGDDYFNDLSQQLPSNGQTQRPSLHGGGESSNAGNDGEVKAKRMACVVCRKRKLKCDGIRPSCGTCSRLGHSCTYDEARKKSGPKRGYVKLLEARLAQVETLLHTQHPNDPSKETINRTLPRIPNPSSSSEPDLAMGFENPDPAVSYGSLRVTPDLHAFAGSRNNTSQPQQQPPSLQLDMSGIDVSAPSGFEQFSWEMVGLGLEEPLPTPGVIEELTQIYFDRIHPSAPMIHRPRYMAALDLPPNMRPPVCLRYAMWCLAASVTNKYESCQQLFYERARKYLQMDEMKGHGEGFKSLAHCQCWSLISGYEFKVMYFPRAWMSVGRATRLAQMLGLQRLDAVDVDVKQALLPPRDWIEQEERRRTFWLAFCQDRYASIGTGWPMTVEESDIMTYLPASDDAYLRGEPADTMFLSDAMQPGGIPRLSSFAGVIVMASIFGRNLGHVHRPGPEDQAGDLNGPFWKRHRALDKMLSDISLGLPDHLRIPSGLPDSNVVFLNMSIHTSTIGLHQAAISKAEKHRLPANVRRDSRIRCITAAAATTSVMKAISHLDLGSMNPFVVFCLYVAARVFVQYLRARPGDQQAQASLQFLMSALQALKRKNPLTGSFLAQLEIDLEGAGFIIESRSQQPWDAKYAAGCSTGVGILGPLDRVKEGQSPGETLPFGTHGLATHTMPSRPAPLNRTQHSTNQVPGSHVDAAPPSLYVGNEHSRFVQMSASTTRSANMGYPSNTSRTVNPHESFSFPSGKLKVSGGISNDHPTPETINSSVKGSSSYTSPSSPGNQNANARVSSESPPDDIVNENPIGNDFFSATSIEDFVNIDGSMYLPNPDIDQDFSFLSQGTRWGGRESGMTPGASASMDKVDSNAWLGMIDDANSWVLDAGFINSLDSI